VFALALSVLLALPVPSAVALPPAATPVTLAQAANLNPAQRLESLFTAELEAEWFAPAFLQQIPFSQIQPLIGQLRQTLGPLQRVEAVADGYRLTFAEGTVPAQIRLDEQGQIVGLFFGPPELAVSLAEAVAAIEAFPGEASLLVLAGDEVLAAVAADQPLAVGSAFKLAVLAAVQRAITADRLQWDTVVQLQREWRSLPSGLLQDWPPGSALTVETLATLMISLSDNTATDALIAVVGRDAVEALSLRNRPFLTTREFFALKNPANSDALAAFRNGDLAAQRQVLVDLAIAPLPPASLFDGDPVALDVEWFFSTRELCALMTEARDQPLMQVNPGVANPEDWETISFKGGSEPGVLNLTTALTDPDGRTYCVSATWNDPTQRLDETALSLLYSGLLQTLSAPPQEPQ
jgi:beta-lactamase class A